jgi:hypothetical protein
VSQRVRHDQLGARDLGSEPLTMLMREGRVIGVVPDRGRPVDRGDVEPPQAGVGDLVVDPAPEAVARLFEVERLIWVVRGYPAGSSASWVPNSVVIASGPSRIALKYATASGPSRR